MLWGHDWTGTIWPIIHNSGYKGDIEIFTDKYSLQIEATLVNKYNQKRARIRTSY
ncbi:hypothetical protein HYD82_03440 [Mycoplasmopsis bovis]|nr:hypothetical protein [Mycoplasmopsis bovis]QQH37638.1 hypothetical protein HYD82_03440 [Mycoplasmopsis bovis]